jgi:MarR family transcriptional regulator, lower aerobic nicotinate degradation pathway regulator
MAEATVTAQPAGSDPADRGEGFTVAPTTDLRLIQAALGGGDPDNGRPPAGASDQALTSVLTTSQLVSDPAFLLLAAETAIRSGFAHELTRWQLRPLQYQILVILSCVGDLQQHELRQALGISKAHLAGLIDGLRALNCVSRTRDGSGRRRYILNITPVGADVLAEARQAIDEYTRSFLISLTSRERNQLTAALRKLYVTAALLADNPH